MFQWYLKENRNNLTKKNNNNSYVKSKRIFLEDTPKLTLSPDILTYWVFGSETVEHQMEFVMWGKITVFRKANVVLSR